MHGFIYTDPTQAEKNFYSQTEEKEMHYIFDDCARAYKLYMMRWLAANWQESDWFVPKSVCWNEKQHSNKLTIFTWNIKTLVNFQPKCVSAICTKWAKGDFGHHIYILLCFVWKQVYSESSKWFLLSYYVSMHFTKLNCSELPSFLLSFSRSMCKNCSA